jgi:SAM-dependent methyltransferase
MLSPDLDPDPVSADPALERRAEALFARLGRPGGLPGWPSEAVQKKYNGVAGLPLMRRTLRFVEALERDGALEGDWKGLDYGCGWGRIASVLRAKGAPRQLDLCDAWPKTLDLLEGAGFENRVFTVSEVLRADEIPAATYDFIYAFSIFTHLRRDAFENNLRRLAQGLKPSGKLYFTVRHADYLPRMKATRRDLAAFARNGFWFRRSGGNPVFGATVVERAVLERMLPPGTLAYAGEIALCQHLYAFAPAPAGPAGP